MTRRMSMTPIQPQETNGLRGFGFTITWEDREEERLKKAKAAIAAGLGIEGAAVAAFEVSNDETVRRVRDLLRERS